MDKEFIDRMIEDKPAHKFLRNISVKGQKEKIETTIPKIQPTEEYATLTLPDGRTAKLPILKGTMGPAMLDIRTLS